MSGIRLLGFSFGLAALIVLLSSGAASAALVSHFTFDQDFTNEVSAALDSPSQTGATIDNGVARVGGGAVLFDGGTVAEYVDAGANALPSSTAGFLKSTVAFWFKAGPELEPGSRFFMGQQNGDPATFGADNRMSFAVETQSNGKLRIFIRAADGTENNNRLRFAHDTTDENEFLEWADGDWHHLAYAWEVDALGLVSNQIFIDGVAVPTVTQENSLEDDPVKAPLNPWEYPPGMFLGALNNRSFQTGSANPSGHVNGWMDDLRVYDDVLSEGQVLALSQIPEPGSLVLAGLALGISVAARRRG